MKKCVVCQTEILEHRNLCQDTDCSDTYWRCVDLYLEVNKIEN